MKKVVMFAGPQHEIPPTKGAAVQTWMYEVSKRMFEYEMHIISIDHPFLPLREFRDGIYFHRIHLSKIYKRIFQKILGWDIYSYNRRVFNIIKKINPDIVHIHNYYNSKEIIEWLRRLNPNIKIILHMHNESEKFKKSGFTKVNAFLGCSDYILEYYKDKIDSFIFKTIYNGVDIDKFQYANSKKNILKDKEKKSIDVFYFGRISEEKGVDKIIEIAFLAKDIKEMHFYCVGEIARGGDRKSYYQNLLDSIDKLNINNITFLNSIPPSKMSLAYQLADFVIVPSKFEEPFCMVAIEAMAARIPLIATAKGGMKEYLKNESNSILIENYSEFSKLAFEAIMLLTRNKELKDNLIKHATLTVEQNFDWYIIAKKMSDVYKEI